MTIPSANQPNSQDFFNSCIPYVKPPVAAGLAIVPAFSDFMRKSWKQLEVPVRKIKVQEGVIEGLKTAPTVGGIVGTQMILQNMLEKQFAINKEESTYETVKKKVQSAFVVGVLSSPFLAVFNAQAAGVPLKKFASNLSIKGAVSIATAIAVQETAFLGGVSSAEPVADQMQQIFGKNKFVEYSGAFLSGAMGSLAGHPANTAITRWQKGMSVSFKHAWYGALYKARACGVFSVAYKVATEIFNNPKK